METTSDVASVKPTGLHLWTIRRIALIVLATAFLIVAVVWFARDQRAKNAGEIYGLLTWSERKCSPGNLSADAARQLLAYRDNYPARFDRAAYAGRVRGEESYRVYGIESFCELVVDPYQKMLSGPWMPSLTGAAWSDGAHWSKKKPPKSPDVAPASGTTAPPLDQLKENYFDKFKDAPPSTRVFSTVPPEGDSDPFALFQRKPATPAKD